MFPACSSLNLRVQHPSLTPCCSCLMDVRDAGTPSPSHTNSTLPLQLQLPASFMPELVQLMLAYIKVRPLAKQQPIRSSAFPVLARECDTHFTICHFHQAKLSNILTFHKSLFNTPCIHIAYKQPPLPCPPSLQPLPHL